MKRTSRNSTPFVSAGGGGDGDPSEGDSSSDSETDLHPGCNQQKKYKPFKKKTWDEESSKPWDRAIEKDDEYGIKLLLKKGKLPTSGQLRSACTKFGRKSPVVIRICREISHIIQSLDDDIIKVEPTYKADFQNDVIFVAYLRQPREEMISDVLGYRVISRIFGEYNAEGREIVEMETRKRLRFPLDQSRQLNQCLEKNSELLMNEHKNLQMISVSHFKSKNYGYCEPEESVCIVLYVRTKGYIPLEEELFPNNLDGIPTDIREGGFEFLSKASDRHNNLKMGCEIAGERNDNGTLGSFLAQNGNIYCLTAAHVLFGLPPPGTPKHVWPSMNKDGSDQPVYQPNPGRFQGILEKDPFGSVLFATYKQGGNDNPGIDVAVIKIKHRAPISGEFPEPVGGYPMEDDDESSIHQPLMYNSGEICEQDIYYNNNHIEVTKFGAATGETRGLLHFTGTSVRHDCLTDNNNGVILFKQIEITRYIEGISFAEKGDSGAIILAAHAGNRNDLRALGLLVGKSSTGTIIATPIHSIFDELELPDRRFMRFESTSVQPSLSVDSGVSQSASASSLALEIQSEIEENYLKPKFESIENKLTENKNETAQLRSNVGSLNDKFDNFAGQMMEMMRQMVQHNQTGNQNTNSANAV